MALNSINTNIAAYFAQSNIGKASAMASSSISRLSSGDRIVRAADDVAAMSAGTSLRTNVTTLRMALINTSQGSSLLQVADGALAQVTDILQRQKAIAVQAGSGSLTDSERTFLDQEFQNLSQEIDRLVDNTNFNGVKLLNGSLSERVDVDNVSSAATSASASITFSVNPAVTETFSLNGVSFSAVTAGATPGATEFELGGTLQETIDHLVTTLNASTNTALSQATYSRSGNSLVITADNGGTQGRTFQIAPTTLATAIDGTGTGTAFINGRGLSSSIAMFTAGLAVTSITAAASAAASAAATPFQDGDVLSATVAAVGYDLVTIQTGDTLESIVNRINANTDVSGFTARITGSANAYNIQLETTNATSDGTLGDTQNDITLALSNTTGTNTAAAMTVHNIVTYLDGGDDTGIGAGDVVGTGVAGNDIVTGQNQQRAEVAIVFPEIADADLNSTTNFGQATNSTIVIGDGTFSVTFTFDGGGSAVEGAVGATLEETLDNMVATINAYRDNETGVETEDYIFNQIEAYRDGTSIKIRTRDYGNATGLSGNAINITIANAPAGASVTNSGNLNNGATAGVSTSGVTNADFIGTVTGFAAEYSGTSNTIDLSITVGDHTYNASNITSNPTANTTIRFSSQDGGGYFDVQMAANNGENVSSQAQADVFAQRLNAAFESLTFSQRRTVSSYTGDSPIITSGTSTGTLIGTSVTMQLDNFDDVTIDSIRVNAPQGSSENGSIVITVDGEEFRSDADISDQLGANQTYRFVSALDSDRFIEFTTGGQVIEFDTDAKAASFEDALSSAFGVGNGDAELKFQVGVTTEDTLSVGVDNISTQSIFKGLTLDVTTAVNAAVASDAIDEAIDEVTRVRAEIGALQSRFDFAAANVESSIQNQDAARGVLLDTDIAAESTAFATSQVQLQAGIAVLAQANLLPQNLLKLIG